MARRPANAEQVAFVATQAAYQHVFPPEVLEGLSVDDREAQWRQTIEGEAAIVWIAQMRGRVIGFASAGPSRTEEGAGELYAIYVLPEVWGSAAARSLMDAAKAWFAGEGYKKPMLWVLADNPRARVRRSRLPLLRWLAMELSFRCLTVWIILRC